MSKYNFAKIDTLEIDTTIASGRHIRIGVISPEDGEKMREGISKMSPQSRYYRFFSGADEQPDQEPAGGRRQHHVPPRQFLDMKGKAFGAAPVKARLHEGDGLAEDDDGAPGGGADDQRQDRQN